MPIHVGRTGKSVCIAAALVFALASACSSKGDSTTSSGSSGSAADATSANADVLGQPNKATGSPITVGVVVDGSDTLGSSGLDTVRATVQYANDYLGGINGHVITVKECLTEVTPSGATQCGVQMASDGVAAVLVPVSTQDSAILQGLGDSGIPYFTYTSASPTVLTQPGSFVMTNAISQIAVPGLVAKGEGDDKVGFIIIDFPAATGPISQIAVPMYNKLGVALQIIPIAPSVADMTPQIQEAINSGADVLSLTGTDEFNISALNALDQLGFKGTIVSTALSPTVVDGVTNGVEGIVGTGAATDDPSDPDVQIYDAVLAKYAPDADPQQQQPGAFATVLGFVRALTGQAAAVDAATVNTALKTMKKQPLPLGGGITFQCGTAPVSFAPDVCSTDVLRWTYGANGEQNDVGLLAVPPEVLTLG